jgi:hypothetical protein
MPVSLEREQVRLALTTVGEKSSFHSLTRFLANKRRKLVKWPDYNSSADGCSPAIKCLSMAAETLNDDWKPISRADFESRLESEVTALPPDALRTYKEHAVTIVEQACFRSEQYGPERVFVVARSASQLLIFDDVEDEFAVGAAGSDGVLREWGLCGDLVDALGLL